MPTSNVNSENRLLSDPIEKELFKERKSRAQDWLKIFARKDDIFKEIYLNYEVKFVREFPKKVLKAKDGH